jgi:hypothetical protein
LAAAVEAAVALLVVAVRAVLAVVVLEEVHSLHFQLPDQQILVAVVVVM